jgi:uncharacterized protein (DUF58 family)
VAVWVPGARAWVVAADLILIAAIALDIVRTPAPQSLHIDRSMPLRAGLSNDFLRRAHLQVGRAGGLELELREEFSIGLEVQACTWQTLATGEREAAADHPLLSEPDDDDPTGGPDCIRLPASGPVDVLRVYRSSRRGVAWVGDMRLRLTGALGLIQRQGRLQGRLEIRIEPALAGLSRTLSLAASDRWHDLGVKRLRRRGGLTEFESLREYVPGDDVRRLDWKAYARRGRPMVREYQEERGQELVLVIDCGRRMGATDAEGDERGWTKLDHALDAALQLAAVALSKGDRVGILAFDTMVRAYVSPARGSRQLESLRSAVFDRIASDQESDLEMALRELGARHRRRATLIILTDVADPLSVDDQRLALSAGARRHRLVFAGLDDPAVSRVASGEQQAPPALRAAALGQRAERALAFRELARSGARVLDTVPAQAAGPLLAAWLDARRAGWG